MPIIFDGKGLKRAYASPVDQTTAILSGGGTPAPMLVGAIVNTFPTNIEPGMSYTGAISGVTSTAGTVEYSIIIPDTTIGLSFNKLNNISVTDIVKMTVDSTVASNTDLVFFIKANTIAADTTNGPFEALVVARAVQTNSPPDATGVAWTLSNTDFGESKTFSFSISGGSDPDNDAFSYQIKDTNGNVTFSKTSNIAPKELLSMTTKAVAGQNEIVVISLVDSKGMKSNNEKVYAINIVKNLENNTPPSASEIAWSGLSEYEESKVYSVEFTGGTDAESLVGLTYNIKNITPNNLVSFNKRTGITANEPINLTTSAVTLDTGVSFVVTCTDSAGLESTDSKPFTFVVKNAVVPNNPPDASTITTTLPTTIPENTPVTEFSISGGVDIENGASITYRIDQTKSPLLTFSKTTGIKPNEVISVATGDVSSDTVADVYIYAVDAGGLSSNAFKKVSTTIKWTNAAPTMDKFKTSMVSDKINERDKISFNFSGAVDPENSGALTYYITNASELLTFNKLLAIAEGENIEMTAGSVDADKPVTFQVYAKDAAGGISEFKTVNITILNENSPPDVSALIWTGGNGIDGGTTASVNFSGATDPDGDLVTYTISAINGPITFSKMDNISAFEPIDLTAGMVSSKISASFKVTAVDEKGSVSIAKSFSIMVNVPNRAPLTETINWNGPASIPSGTSANVSFTGGSDPDSDTFTYSIADVVGPLTFSTMTGITPSTVVKLTAGSVTTATPASFTVNATDVKGLSGIAKSFNISVSYSAKAPVTTGISFTGTNPIDAGGSGGIQIFGATDPNGEAITYTIGNGTPPDILSFGKQSGIGAYEQVTMTCTKTLTKDTDVTFPINAVNTSGLLGTPKNVTIKARFVNGAPIASGITWTGPSTINAGGSAPVSFAGAKDPNGDKVTYNIAPGTGLTFSKTSGILANERVTMYASSSVNNDIPVDITVTATDDKGLVSTDKKTFTSTIKFTNKPPTGAITVTPINYRASDPLMSGTSRSFSLSGVSDPNGDPVVYNLMNISGPISFNKTSGIANGEPVTITAGSISSPTNSSVTIASFDSRGAAGPTLVVAGNIVLGNTGPNTAGLTWNGASSYAVPASSNGCQFWGATDPDGDPITYEITNVSSGLSFSKTTGITAYENITITAGKVAPSTMSFTVNAKDSKGAYGTPKNFSFTTYNAGPPTGTINLNPINYNIGDMMYSGKTYQLTLSGVSDPNGGRVYYNLTNITGPYNFSKTTNIGNGEQFSFSPGPVYTQTDASVLIASFNDKGVAGPTLLIPRNVIYPAQSTGPSTSGMKVTVYSSSGKQDYGLDLKIQISGGTAGSGALTYSLVGGDGNWYRVNKNSGISPNEIVLVNYLGNTAKPTYVDVVATDGSGKSAGPVRLYFGYFPF